MSIYSNNQNILSAINSYLNESDKNKGRLPEERYTSFDYCYNYFYSFFKDGKLDQLGNEENMQTSCLQLGFYLASWGMFRGKSFLLQKSVKHYEKLIRAISRMPPELWVLDVDKYNKENVEKLLKCKRRISYELRDQDKLPTDTLITKIMLGVFGNVPAFDRYVKMCFNVNRVNKKSLNKIGRFYEDNKSTFDNIEIPTLDFATGKETSLLYPKAKLIDMYGFIKGQD